MSQDLNDDTYRKLINPESFDYTKYYDDYNDVMSIQSKDAYLEPPKFGSS